MATASTPSSRASLLAGLRTGGVRSASQPHQVPHTAAPGGSFNVPRFASVNHPSNPLLEDEEDDQLADMVAHNLSLDGNHFSGVPMTASAAEGGVNKFQQQQVQQPLFLRQIAAHRARTGGGNLYGDHEMQAQIMQMEMLRYQALQQAQYQAELIAHVQRQQQQQPTRGGLRHPSMEPMTAGPMTTSFDLRSNAASQLRAHAQQAEYRSALSTGDDTAQMPMTAAIGGKFATRTLNPNANSFVTSRFGERDDDGSVHASGNLATVSPTSGRTTVISGGTSLGTPTTPGFNASTPSKSDTAVSWRRGSSTTNNSVLRSASATPPINTKINRTPPSTDETSPSGAGKSRPQPLRFSVGVSSPLPAVAIDTSNVEEDVSSASSKGDSPISASTPSTPPSAHSSLSGESKKPYEGLGIGRPAVNGTINGTVRQASLPSRQPKGPPSGADELGPRNFATRLRRKAIGGLGALITARERRDLAIEIQAY